ncbi:unnamed protein product [Kuraishia capsulata CBS 1993]|uniref:Phosphatidic acid phosphatase type 2/haloperoxidase domain-containing protein n=1 Tax=Kuraishia capsulata CBS 1993 TaxID=1382522 RepID=W6MFJ0_9ASCO|nr:uncharacterized protein KUCA_T00000322001 [Kuraishia capsulata CBS 1993]CDK24361.1 unnamed protein product [Kuraishia capsulata CBS 1993]
MATYRNMEESVSGTDLAHQRTRLRSHSIDLVNTSEFDAGHSPDSYYKARLSPQRYRLRQLLLPLVRAETAVLARIQAEMRSPFGDIYFPWTANLGSHTFYVLILPFPLWFGYLALARDLVFVLGLGIYFSGLVKDYLCLPRPESPPLHRITMSKYTTQEYGCPSSHSANAAGLVLVISKHLWAEWTGSLVNYALVLVLVLYYTSLVSGRVYCGMHGFVDISVGTIIGVFVVILRLVLGQVWDAAAYSGSLAFPLFILFAYYLSIAWHPVPLDACPCFDDSVAFVGVLVGLELAHWSKALITGDATIPYSFAELGIFRSILRLGLGVLCVVVWKELVSKPVLTVLYRPIFRAFPKLDHSEADKTQACGAMKSRFSLEILVRVSAYAGVSAIVVASYIVMDLCGCGVQ